MRLLFIVSSVFGIQRVKFATCPDELCIMPVDGAEFLTGAKFDIRVEVHGKEAPPGDIKVTLHKRSCHIFKRPINKFFRVKKEPKLERWNFTYVKDNFDLHRSMEGNKSVEIPIQVASKAWRDVSFQKPGIYTVTIKAGKYFRQVEWISRSASCKPLAKNVILFITDGTSVGMLTAARVMAKKQRNGKFFDKFEMDKMDHMGHVLTHSLDSMMTDSSNSASAYHTGHKTSVFAVGVYPDSSPDPFDDPKQELLSELARRRSNSRGGKMAIGIVSTAEVQDATPAAAFAHTRLRKHKDKILDQMLNSISSTIIKADVYMGGGGAYFHNKIGGKSLNGADYYQKFSHEGYHIVHNAKDLLKYQDDKPLLGIFHKGDMDVLVDRHIYFENLKNNKASPIGDEKDALDQPSLVEMTKKTLEVLKKRGGDAGFFAVIEAASPDKQMHNLDYHRSLVDIIEFDQAVKAAVEWIKENDLNTTVIVTADHAQGYDVYGSVDTELFNKGTKDEFNVAKREAIGIYHNAGWPDYEDKDGDGYPDSLEVRTTFAGMSNNHPDIYEDFQINRTHPRIPVQSLPEYAANISYKAYTANENFNRRGFKLGGNLPTYIHHATHAMSDVAIFSSGPGSHLFGTVMDSTEVFFNIAYILGLGDHPDPRTCQSHLTPRRHY